MYTSAFFFSFLFFSFLVFYLECKQEWIKQAGVQFCNFVYLGLGIFFWVFVLPWINLVEVRTNVGFGGLGVALFVCENGLGGAELRLWGFMLEDRRKWWCMNVWDKIIYSFIGHGLSILYIERSRLSKAETRETSLQESLVLFPWWLSWWSLRNFVW